MRYIKFYDINRKMHAAPRASVCNTISGLCWKHHGLDIKIEDQETGDEFCFEDITTLMTLGDIFSLGGTVKIIAIGEYPIETLRNSAEMVGAIFSFKDTSSNSHEVLYRAHYGYPPGEKPEAK